MILIPYKRIKLKSSLKKNEVESVLRKLVLSPSWRLNSASIYSNDIIEGTVNEKSFTIAFGKFGLTYGKTTLLPLMKGKVFEDILSTGSIINGVVRPSNLGMLIILLFYFICLIVIYFSIIKDLPGGIIVGGIFYLLTYVITIINYNIKYSRFVKLIKENLL